MNKEKQNLVDVNGLIACVKKNVKDKIKEWTGIEDLSYELEFDKFKRLLWEVYALFKFTLNDSRARLLNGKGIIVLYVKGFPLDAEIEEGRDIRLDAGIVMYPDGSGYKTLCSKEFPFIYVEENAKALESAYDKMISKLQRTQYIERLEDILHENHLNVNMRYRSPRDVLLSLGYCESLEKYLHEFEPSICNRAYRSRASIDMTQFSSSKSR